MYTDLELKSVFGPKMSYYNKFFIRDTRTFYFINTFPPMMTIRVRNKLLCISIEISCSSYSLSAVEIITRFTRRIPGFSLSAVRALGFKRIF